MENTGILLSSADTSIQRYSIRVFQEGVPFAPLPLPAPHARANAAEITRQFSKLTKDAEWKCVEKIDCGHFAEPEGMVRIGNDRVVISHNRYTERTQKFAEPVDGFDRSAGAGFGMLTVWVPWLHVSRRQLMKACSLDGKGNPIAELTMNGEGEMEYHLGGIE